MSKISIYEVVPVPKLADKLVGTSVGGDPEDITYNFTLSELLNLFIPNIPGNTLQGVLDFGNTATQNINLTGIITTTTLNVGSTANILNSNLTGQTKITGGLYDRLNSIGTAGQVLTSTGTQVEWYTIPTVIPDLQQVLTSGNTAVNNIILTGNLSANNAALLTSTISTSLTVLGTLRDGLSSVGANNQVLSSNVTGVRWVNLPVYSATSPLLYNSGTGVFSIQQANASQNGYLSSADWITFDGKQTSISLTTTGNSGASTLVGATINVPNYTLSGLGGVPLTRTLTINGVTFNLSADRTWTLATGVSSVSATTPLSSTGGANPDISIQQSSSSLDGYLSSTDWLTFNSKQPAGNYITSLTGEATAAGPGAASVILSNAAVIGKLLTGLSITGSAISSSDSILTAFGKVQNQINGLIGGVQFQGVWNAATNTPALVSSVGTQGYYYIVSVAGNTNLNGITDWQIGDWAIFNGSTWNKVDNTDLVTSVNGQVGAVSLTTDNIPEGATNLYYLDSRARAALSFAAGSGAYNSTTGVITIPTDNSQILNGAGYITLVSLSATSPLTYNNTTGAFAIQVANTTQDGYLSSTDWNTFNGKQPFLGGTGLVKSVAGVISYITDNSANWNTAYNDSIVSAAVTGTATKTLTLNQQDGGTITASWSDIDTGLTSVGVSMPSAFTVTNSPLTSNGTIAITGSGNTLQYVDGTGALQSFPSLTGYVPYTGATANVNLGIYNLTAASLIKNGGTSGQFLKADGSVDSSAYIVLGSLSATAPLSYNNTTGVFTISQSGASTNGYLSSTDWNTFNNKQATITLTTTGSSGASTLIGNTLNIPNYANLVTSVFGRIGAVVATEGDYSLTQLSDVTITTPSSGQVLKYNGTAWVNDIDTDTGITSLNGLTALTQTFAVGTSGTDFAISSVTSTHTFNLPTASVSNRGALSSADWTTFNNKQNAITLTTTGTSGASTLIGATLNIPQYQASGTYVTSVTGTSPIVSSGGTAPAISIPVATTSVNGYLSSTDWLTFNSKQPAGNYITSLTGEATGVGPGATAVTLSTAAVTGKLLTGLNLAAGGTISATDSILIAFGKTQNQISALLGGVIFKGVWNANTNTPTLVSSVGTQGWYYIVNVAGTTNLNGITDWQVGDWAIFNGTVWDKVDNTDAVSSVNGFTGAVNLTTDNIPEGATNLYYTNTRARAALSFVAGSGAYNSTTGVITIPTNNNQITNGSNYITLGSLSAGVGISYNNTTGVITNSAPDQTVAITASTGISVTGTYPNFTITNTSPSSGGTVTSVAALTIGTTGTDLSSSVANSTTTPVITLNVPTASATNRGALASADWTTFNGKQSAITLTTTGTSGAATLVGATLNIPQYQGVLTNPVTGTGTTNTLPKFTGTSTIGNSNITDTGSLITLGSNSYVNGSLGVGSTTLTGYSLRVSKLITGATTAIAVYQSGQVQSDVTVASYGFYNEVNTPATAFTLPAYYHYAVAQGTIGAGSAITTQTGFYVPASLISATTNFGFRGVIPSGTNRWNLYMDGTAANYMAGVLNIGTTTLSGYTLDVNGTARVSGDATFSSNVGIGGTAVPYSGGAKCLNLFSNTTIGEVRITNSTTGNAASAGLVLTQIGVNGYIVNANNGFLAFATNNTTRATLDSSGNLGLGVTPSAWSTLKALQISSQSSLSADGTSTQLSTNAFFDGGWKYIQTDEATNYYQLNGQHVWRQAISGSANAAITWTTPLTIASTGAASFSSTAGVPVSVTSTAATSTFVLDNTNANLWGGVYAVRVNGVDKNYFGTLGSLLGTTSTDATIWATAGNGFRVYTNGNNLRLNIDSSGNTAIGYTTNPSLYKLDVNGTGRFSANLQVTTAAQTTFSLISTETSGRTWSFHTAGTTYGSGAGSFVLRNNGTDALVFNSSSAATFSSSVNVNGILQVKSTSSSPSIWAGGYGGGITILADNATSNRYLDLSIVDSAGAIAAQGIRITSGGNVLIGTTTDSGYKLDVNGSFRALAPIVTGDPNGYKSSQFLYFASAPNTPTTYFQVFNNGNGSDFSQIGIGSNNVIYYRWGTNAWTALQSAITNPVTGTGNNNYLAKFTSTGSTIGNSAITEDGTTVTLVSRALSGTSATFSSSVTATSGIFNNGYYNAITEVNGSPYYGSALYLSGDAGSDQKTWRMTTKYASPNVALVFEYSTTALSYGSNPTGLTYAEAMRFSPTGAATFSSSVTATQLDAFTSQGGSKISATHGTGGSFPKASGISFGATSTSLTVSNNGGNTTFTGGAGIYASNSAASNNPTDLVFWTTSGGTPATRLTIASTGAATFSGTIITGGTTANASAQLQADSTTKGFLPPRMTSAQRTAIGTPATGLIVYQTDGVEGLWLNTSTGWRELTVV